MRLTVYYHERTLSPSLKNINRNFFELPPDKTEKEFRLLLLKKYVTQGKKVVKIERQDCLPA